MTVGDRLAQLLAESGVDRVFGVPGGQTLPLYEGIRKSNGAITHVLMRDERSAGFAADAYARLTGKLGVCDATVGPG
ncbi:MAG: thiamine pyrophosphate-binding protein, partial [Proteobacteria bacterium]|nr:thiamine pyrophosphate-binding protein [Pseudomonadota bacterium]